MNHEELISAYLDDELSSAQREEIERLLAADAGARRLRDELRAQREALAQVPRLSIGRDLTEDVLRAAERRMLLEPAAPAAPPGGDAVPWMRRARRPAAWAALVLAAGLLIMLLSPRPRQAEVAVATATPEHARTRRAEDARVDESASQAAERRLESPSAELAPPRDAAELGVPTAPPGEGAERSVEPALGKSEFRSPGKGGFLKDDSVNGHPANAPRPSSAATQMKAAPPAAVAGQQAEIADSVQQSLQFDRPAAAFGSGTLLICDASPEAVASNAFAQVLANNDVRVDEQPEGDSPPGADAATTGQAAVVTTGGPESNVRATTWVVEATEDQMLGILDELARQPAQFSVAVAPPPSGGTPIQQQPLPANEYLSQFPNRGAYQARKLSQRSQQQADNFSNAWIVNRLSQAPGGPVNVEVPEPDKFKKERVQAREPAGGRAGGAGGAILGRRETTQTAEADSPPLQSYMVILREAPTASTARQQAAPQSAEPAAPPP